MTLKPLTSAQMALALAAEQAEMRAEARWQIKERRAIAAREADMLWHLSLGFLGTEGDAWSIRVPVR